MTEQLLFELLLLPFKFMEYGCSGAVNIGQPSQRNRKVLAQICYIYVLLLLQCYYFYLVQAFKFVYCVSINDWKVISTDIIMADAAEIPTVPLPQEEVDHSTSPRAFLNSQDVNSKEQILKRQTVATYKPKGSPPLTKFDIDEHTHVIRTLNKLQEHEVESTIRTRRRNLGPGANRATCLLISPTSCNTQHRKWAPLPPISPSSITPISRARTQRMPPTPDNRLPRSASTQCNFT